jgi:hypothetical protein
MTDDEKIQALIEILQERGYSVEETTYEHPLDGTIYPAWELKSLGSDRWGSVKLHYFENKGRLYGKLHTLFELCPKL